MLYFVSNAAAAVLPSTVPLRKLDNATIRPSKSLISFNVEESSIPKTSPKSLKSLNLSSTASCGKFVHLIYKVFSLAFERLGRADKISAQRI